MPLELWHISNQELHAYGVDGGQAAATRSLSVSGYDPYLIWDCELSTPGHDWWSSVCTGRSLKKGVVY